jgi:hypothetical protein
MAREKRGTWEERVREWKESGLTAEAFAESHGFKSETLRHWKRQNGENGVATLHLPYGFCRSAQSPYPRDPGSVLPERGAKWLTRFDE